jgi:hypothetical protein
MKLESLLIEVCSIQKRKYGIYIIDDSSEIETIEQNKSITKKYNNLNYLGVSQYRDFYKIKDGSNERQMLGDVTWNLGIARNFALEHSRLCKYKKILFIDDDITEIDERKIEEGFSVLTEENFVSFTLKGVEDDSIVGHIAKQVGVIDDGKRMLSGGFLFLSPASISQRFYNIYNEDWIFQILEKEKKQIILPYTVRHNLDKDVNWTLDQALFQEPGELIVEGLLEDEKALSLDNLFWNNVLYNRIKFIEEIKEGTSRVKFQHGYDICRGILKWLNQLDGYLLQRSIEQIKKEHHEHKI